MSLLHRIGVRLDGRRAEGMAAEVTGILAEPGRPESVRLPWLQRTRQEILTSLAAETSQPDGWPLGGDVHV